MSQYRTGSVKCVNASTLVRADSVSPNVPNFLTNVAVGDLFKRRYENTWYQVSSVKNATLIQIAPAYAGTSGTGLGYIIERDFTPNLSLPEQSSGDFDTADIYTRAIRKIDEYLPEAITTWIQDTSVHTRVSATAFNASGDYTSIYVANRFIKVRGNTAAASQNYYSLTATTAHYNATTGVTYVQTETTCQSATPTRYYYAAAVNVLTDQIKDTHIDWGTGSNQVNASDIPIIDSGGYFTATKVESALRELKTDTLLNQSFTASVDRNWVITASTCTRASTDVFTASGNQIGLFVKSTYVKIVATAVASYYSYVSTTPTYNATLYTTRVTLASQTLPASPLRFYTDTGNTATRFFLKNIGHYPNDYFNTNYYMEFTTGSLDGEVRQIHDWRTATPCVVATTAFTATPGYGDSLRLLKNDTSIVSASDDTITINHRLAGYFLNVTDPLVLNKVTATSVSAGHILPKADNTYSLGAAATRWANVFTGDLHLKNEDGDWTLKEGKSELFFINNVTGKRYKILMEEM